MPCPICLSCAAYPATFAPTTVLSSAPRRRRTGLLLSGQRPLTSRATLGRRLHRKLQCPAARRAAQCRDLLRLAGIVIVIESWRRCYNTVSAARLSGLQTASTGGLRARVRRVAGCATSIGSAGHAGATASAELTFHLDHSM